MFVHKPVGATSKSYCNRKYMQYDLLPTGAQKLLVNPIHAPPTSTSLMWSPYPYFVKGTSLWSSSLCSLLQRPTTSSLLGWNILLSTRFSNSLKVSHTYKREGDITDLYILDFKFSEGTRDGNRFWTEWQKAFPEFHLLLTSSWMQFWFVTVVPKYLNSATFLKDFSF